MELLKVAHSIAFIQAISSVGILEVNRGIVVLHLACRTLPLDCFNPPLREFFVFVVLVSSEQPSKTLVALGDARECI